MVQHYDAIIIGGGPGGTTAARILAEGGRKTALVEDTHLGGTCLNCGCIPTKFWLAATAPGGQLRGHARFGTLAGEVSVNFAALQQRKERFVKGSSQTLGKTLASLGVTVFSGRGLPAVSGFGPCPEEAEQIEVRVEGASPAVLRAPVVILATGSHSASFPGLAPDGEAVLDSTMLLGLDAVPKSLLVVGGGAIGLEFSDFFACMGTAVTIVEGMPQLAPTEDADIAEELRKILQKSGLTCITGEKVAGLITRDGKAELTFENGQTLVAEKALLAVGRKANTAGFGVSPSGEKTATGLCLDRRGGIVTDECLHAAPGVYAVGDVNGRTLLAHAADHQGAYVARRILGREEGPYRSGPVPSCVFGQTELMRAGKTAREVLAGGGACAVSKAPLMANPIAQAHASSAGFVKAVWENGRLAGMAAVGHGVSHLVTAAQLLVLGGFAPETLEAFMFAHPTLDEALRAALTAPQAGMAADS